MYTITNITKNYLQTQNVVLQDGSSFKFEICYKPMQYGWFIQDLVYGDIEIKGMRICVNPNMLHQFMNILPFGIACYTTLGREPTQLEDFSSGNFQLLVLSKDETTAYKAYLSG